jgi:holin-like protein
MRFFLAFAILLAFNILGVLAQNVLHIPLPGNVIGLLLLLTALSLGLIKLHHVEPAANLLLKHMMLFFAPIIVGTLALTHLIANNWLPLLATLIISTLITLIATATVASAFKAEPPHD